jgi:hypothetical protein
MSPLFALTDDYLCGVPAMDIPTAIQGHFATDGMPDRSRSAAKQRTSPGRVKDAQTYFLS